MNKKIVISAVGAIALVAVALFFLLGGLRLLGGPRGQFGGHFGNPSDFNAGFRNFDWAKESLGLPATASNEDVLAALGLPSDASSKQVMDALIQMGIQPDGGLK